jgi:hypothetical protein
MKAILRLAFVICMAGNHLVTAQSLFGTILGTVTDSSRAVVTRARLTIRNEATNVERAVTTDSLGNYEVPTLPVGTYQVTCESAGFKRAIVKGIVLQVDERQRVDLRLQVGEVVQTVEISAVARLIETDTATQGTVIDNKSVLNLPLNGRNFQQLAILGPGVDAPVAGSGAYFSVAGARSLGTSFLMDGTTNSNTNANVTFINPSIDLIQEFKVLRNTYNAEFGHGASQVNVVTKSGTNNLHLTLFEFLRNDKIQARNFFDQSQKPAYRRNQFGGTVSGPIILPKLYSGRNRTFFLFNYEGDRERTPSTIRATVPTQAQLNGDLSGIATVATDPLSKLPFPGSQIPSSRIDSASRNFIQFIPVTDARLGSVGAGLNYITAGSGVSSWDQVTGRVDHSFSSDSNGFVRYTMTDNTTLPLALLPSYPQATLSRQQSAVAGHNLVIRPNLINEFRAGFARHTAHYLPNAARLSDRKYAEIIGLKNLLSLSIPSANAPPTVGITGFTGFGGSALITQRVNTFSYVDNLTWIRGKHSFKFGADIRRLLHDTRNLGVTQGSFGFTGAFSKAALADFLLGYAQTNTGTAPPGVDGVNLSTLWQVFAQDDWKAAGNLTFSFGLRYEYYAPWINDRNRISRFDPDFPGGRVIYPADKFYFVPGLGFIPTDKPLASRGLYEPDRNDLAPRFGFAWRPFGNNRSSVRGSYGIFIDNSLVTDNLSISNPPHLVKYSITNDLQAPSLIPWSQLFPPPDAVALSLGVSSVTTVTAKMPSGYVQQWSLNLQREIFGNLALELGYMGSKGTDLDKRRYLNQAALDLPGQRTSIASRLPYPAFAAGLASVTHTGMSHYDGFISRVERRFSNGLSFLVAYTYSKSIDNSSFSGQISAQPNYAQNAHDERSEKALSYFDVPHRIVASYIYELPFGPGKRFLKTGGVAGYLVGGWRLSGITQYQTGNPWSIFISGDIANVGTTQQRADLVGDPFPDGFVRGGTARLAFNRAAFANPKSGTFGNSGRNIMRDASMSNTDLSIARDIRLAERMRLEFRTEFFNVWNHTQFQQFANTLGSATFGTWNSARDPRIVQFGLKLNY